MNTRKLLILQTFQRFPTADAKCGRTARVPRPGRELGLHHVVAAPALASLRLFTFKCGGGPL